MVRSDDRADAGGFAFGGALGAGAAEDAGALAAGAADDGAADPGALGLPSGFAGSEILLLENIVCSLHELRWI